MDMDTQSDQIDQISTALSKAQKMIGKAVYDKSNPHFKSKYASYEAVRDSCREALSDNGLSVTHQMVVIDGKRVMITQLSHLSGQWLRSYLSIPQDKETPQGVGSGISYSMRYSLAALLSIPSGDEDDDGERAEAPYRQAQQVAAKAAEPISEAQAKEIEDLIDMETELRDRILSHYKVPSIKMIPTTHFETIVINLRKLKGKQS